jgi:phosphoribosylanthranilate isomerase
MRVAPAAKVELMFIKICGVTNEEDALLAVALGADAVGFIFAPSTRQIAPSRVRDIVRRLPTEILTVGVFRNELPARVIEIVNEARLSGAQLHGHESVADTRWVAERVPVCIKAFPAGVSELDNADAYGVGALLIDSPKPGSGEVFDWSLAEGAPSHRRVILAGGLNPDNVEEAISRVQPWGVDVASGVESSSGRKDPRLLRAFIANAQAAPTEEHNQAPADGFYNWEEELR